MLSQSTLLIFILFVHMSTAQLKNASKYVNIKIAAVCAVPPTVKSAVGEIEKEQNLISQH